MKDIEEFAFLLLIQQLCSKAQGSKATDVTITAKTQQYRPAPYEAIIGNERTSETRANESLVWRKEVCGETFTVCTTLKRGWSQLGVGLFSLVTSNRTRGSGLKGQV